MTDKPKTKWRWRILRWGLVGVAVLVTLLAVAVTEENWRGKRAWENYKRQSAVQGDPVDGTAYSTNQIPDDQNFAKAPIFAALLGMKMKWNEHDLNWEPADTNRVDTAKMSTTRTDNTWPKKAYGDWRRAKLTDLQDWQNYYRNAPPALAGEFPVALKPQSPAADVLLALSRYDSAIEELRVASHRPYSRFGNYDANDTKTMAILMRYLGDVKSACSVIQLRALAELASGQTTQAFEDVQLLLRLNGALSQEPLLISQLVGLATVSLVIQPIYEGLVRHQWSDAQLSEFEKGLVADDCLADYQKAMRGERAFAIKSMETERLTGEFVIDPPSKNSTAARLMPGAFFYQNELSIARLAAQYLSLIDLRQRIASPPVMRQLEKSVDTKKSRFSPYNVLAMAEVPWIIHVTENFARNQSYNDLAEVACALERYRLAHGNYPETLSALVPQFIDPLPHDIINGQPLHYHCTDDGKFVLYSVGWNEKDDEGNVGLTKAGTVDPDKGDWVWRYP